LDETTVMRPLKAFPAAARRRLRVVLCDIDDTLTLDGRMPAASYGALERLHQAGIPTGIALAPLIPGLNDHQIPAILERARAAGAERAFMTLLHLPGEVLPVFEARLQAAFPERSAKVLHALQSMRSGHLQENRFGRRMRGTGPRWEIIEKVFALHCRKLGLKADRERSMTRTRDPRRQGELFG